jgi:antitoxin component of MazEF toxin-antitoxin module
MNNIKKNSKDELDIYSLVDKITSENIHKEVDCGKSAGKEV